MQLPLVTPKDPPFQSSPRRGWVRWKHPTCLALILWCLVATSGHAQISVTEPELKAEIIRRFTIYIDWPDDGPGFSDFVVGFIGDDPISAHLKHAMGGYEIKGHMTAIRNITNLDEIDSCHLVFISASSPFTLDSILTRTRHRPILTVADSPGFADQGVIINLVLTSDGEVRFEINETEARNSGLRVSSRLMRLARIVDPVE
jgi:hypothetical protein